MTDFQKNAEEFENLSKRIILHIFKDTDATINKTGKTKDGGYDIVVECNNGYTTHKAYFECKLRQGNMTLRDIAANVIIAYNEGAVTMVALTNHNYTVQADEHLSNFLEKTILNIKVIIGDEINSLIEKFSIPISGDLAALIRSKKTNRNLENKLLQVDFSKDCIYEQLFAPVNNLSIGAAIEQQGASGGRLLAALTVLQDGGLLVLSGFIGVGKRSFANSITSCIGGITVLTDASLHQTQERVLIDLLFSIWGISVSNIFNDFTETHIDEIIERLSQKNVNRKTLNILRRIFGDNRIVGVNDENYNSLVCDYIVETIQIHDRTFQYMFVFENLAYAKHEIYVLLSYLIKKLAQKKIPCIIIEDTEEFDVQRSVDLHNTFRHVPGVMLMEIKPFTEVEALEYIQSEYLDIPTVIAKHIIEHVGSRRANISIFLEHLRIKGASLSNYKHIEKELESMQPNSMPTVLHGVMSFYKQQKSSVLFDAMYLFNGKIHERLCSKLQINIDTLELLSRGGIIAYHQGYYVCANRIVYAIINDWGHDDSPKLRRLATEILKILNDEHSLDIRSDKAYLLRYIGNYECALLELFSYIEHLKSERQLDAICEICDVIIDIYQRQRKPLEKITWMIYQLNILAIMKSLYTSKAIARLSELSRDLSEFAYLHLPKIFTFAYDCLTFFVDFKKGNYDISVGSNLKLRQYYEDAVNGVIFDNTDDWLGKICDRYVLCIKESDGYEAALIAYKRVIDVIPDSDRLKRGYLSHLACMCLHNAPDKAFTYYNEIIETLHNKKSIYIPFHEYVDRAMCKLLANDSASAEALARNALEICEANAILDECGRSLNILGCALACRGKKSEAKACFKESLEMLKISGYKLYSWRSQLNFVHMELDSEGNKKLAYEELNEAYQCFKLLHGAKIQLLLKNGNKETVQMREYHALLAFALYRSKITGKKDNVIMKDFDLGEFSKQYKNDLYLLLSNPSKALPGSVFYRAGMIMTVG